MSIYLESSLQDSIVFNTLNTNSQLNIMINECMKNGIMIKPDHIEEQLIQIKKTKLSPLADHVLEAYGKGEIVILYSKTIKIPQAIPFVVLKLQGTLKAIVFTNNYATLSDNTKAGGAQYLNIPMKDLYVLMEGAYTALQYQIYPIQITKNLGLMRICANTYTAMILRILNKEYALSMDPEIFNRVSFCISRFFLDNIWESRNLDINTAYSINNILNANKQDLLILAQQYNDAGIKSFQDLINFLKTVTKRLDKMSMRYMTQCYLNMFKPSAIFGMECLPYFIYTLQTALLGSFLVNQPIITDIVRNIKGINTFYAELSKSI